MRTLTLPLLVVVVLLTSCTRYYYRPNAVNVPLFTGAGQAHFALAGDVANNSAYQETTGNVYRWNANFLNAQAAVSPIDHLGFFLNYSTYNYQTTRPDTVGNANAHAHLLEGAVGGYFAKGKKVKMVADCYVGYGAGPIRSDVNMNIHRVFIQPGIGMRSPAFDVSFNLRLSGVHFNHFSSDGHGPSYLANQGLVDSISGIRIDHQMYGFAEPTLTMRTGYRFLKIQMQIATAQSINLVPWSYNGFMYTLGLYFSLEEALAMGKKK